MRITILSDAPPTSRQSWTFVLLTHPNRITMVLESWAHEQRASPRHGWKSDSSNGTRWQRLLQRENRVERPKPPSEVITRALEQAAELISYEG